MAAYELLLLNTSIPQIQAAQSGDTYLCPRELAVVVNSATDAVRITQTGAGNALVVEDSANPDSTPFVVTAAGDVGIGTNNPGAKLQVVSNTPIRMNNAGSTSQADLYFADSGATLKVENFYGTGSNITFGTNANGAGVLERMRLDSSGNLGLGVTPSAWAGGYLGFQIRDAAFASYTSGFTWVGNNWYSDGNNKYIANGYGTLYEQTAGKHVFYNAGNNVSGAGAAMTLTQAMTLNASGNLGVGTTNPLSRIHGVASDNGNDDHIIRLGFAFNASSESMGSIGTHNDSDNTGGLKFSTASGGVLTERARITSDGYFKASNDGAYIFNTGTFHELNGDGTAETLIVDNTISASAAAIVHTRGAANFAGKHYVAEKLGTSVFEVAANGNVTNTNGSYGTISDQKLKQDIVDAGSQWADIKAIRFRKYRMKSDVAANPDAPALLGVVAQELEQTSPGLVDESPDRDADGNDLGTTTKSVKTSVLLMKAAVALQEAMARIEQLEAKVAAMGA